ncbi:MAG: RluA family pseudouridine synthase [Halanaerobiales bacterium]|nr:RluA family pseudouridine synthase [Halanaerobiales bacterium]
MLKPHVDHFQNPNQIVTYQIQPEETGMTIHQILKNRLHISRRLLRKIRGSYRVRYNKEHVTFDTKIQEGDILEFNFYFDEKTVIEPEPMKLSIIYEDSNLLIINKPAGILVHPAATERTGTLANGVLNYQQSQGNNNLFRPIHRLDRNTSGVILIGKNHYGQNYMVDQFQRQNIHREYLAIVHDVILEDVGIINAPIGRAEDSIILRKIDTECGQKSITHFRVLKRYQNTSVVSLRLETGRTHQIRVHLSHIGHPLLGDTLYGGREELIKRHALHSWRITCKIPLTHETKKFTAPLATDMKELIRKL